ncbi:MAG: hypothetical protein GF334_02960 [Candidatus Altiarchaeales archaeon]|nr:hypothetical protein [Candidatus Altiarchaeales archaeon]
MKIISAGLPRSGSTLVMQMLKILYSDFPLQKVHGYIEPKEGQIRICTYRHPFAAAVSNARIYNDLSDEHLKNSAIYIRKMAKAVDLYTEDGVTLMLRYEDFYLNRKLIVSSLVERYGTKFSDMLVEKALEYSSIERNLERQRVYSDFAHWDSETHIHGGHISEYKGDPTSWRNYVSSSQIQILVSILNPVRLRWGY